MRKILIQLFNPFDFKLSFSSHEIQISENGFHSDLLGLQSAVFVEFHGAFVAGPYVKRDIITAVFAGKIKNRVVKCASDMGATACLIHTQIIDVKGFNICQYVIIEMLLEDTESVALQAVIFICCREDRPFFIF